MFARFTNITNDFKRLGKVYSNKKIVTKILRSLPRRWEPKVTAIQKAKDMYAITLDDLLGSLVTHEMTLNGPKTKTDLKRAQEIVLKSTLQEDSDDTLSEDDDIKQLSKSFK